MSASAVKVSNVSLKSSENDLKEFFSFSGDIIYVELKREDEGSQTAYVTFKDPLGADTAVLLTGATVNNNVITVTLDADYQLPPAISAKLSDDQDVQSPLHKAEDVVTSLLAKSFIYGREAFTKAKSFDDKHRLSSTALTKITSFNERMRLSEKINEGTSVVNSKMKEMDKKYQVYEKTKTTYAVVEEKVNTAGSTMMKNPYVQSGATWVSDTSNKMAKVAEEVGEKTKEKVRMEEEQKKKMEDDDAKVHLSESGPLEGDSSETSPRVATSKAVSAERGSPKATSLKDASPMEVSPKVEA